MDRNTIEFVRSALPEGRTVFYDFEDRYAFMLLEATARDDVIRVPELKKGRFQSLLHKPRVRDFLAQFGKPEIPAEELQTFWPKQHQAFRLTVGTWPSLDEKPDPSWHQITQRGWNLVLQLNFSESHKRKLAGIIPDWQEWYECSGHPIAENGELTLAWARIDFNLETKEALIEEIQSDWVRDSIDRSNPKIFNKETSAQWGKYVKEVLAPQSRKWPETMLTAAIWFLTGEMGIRTIFYHTFTSGQELKRIGSSLPPRSLYTDLPKKFCFDITHNGPLFIRDSARKDLKKLFTDPKTQWFILDLDQ